MARISYKVRALMERLHTLMVSKREDEDDHGNYTCAAWVQYLNWQETGVTVTDPQVRRCLQLLRDVDRVKECGHGRKGWRAITLGERLADREKEREKAALEVVKERVGRLGIAMDTTWDKRAIIDREVVEAMAEMLEDFPGIAEQYFPMDEAEQSRWAEVDDD